MKFDLLGRPGGEPQLRLDYRRFIYVGKFVTTATGKTMLRGLNGSLPPLDDDRPVPAGGPDFLLPLAEDAVAAVAFNEGRTDPTAPWLRYVTVRRDRRGDGLGPNLLRRTYDTADRDYKTVHIAANNPFIHEACRRAGLGFTNRETGVAGLVLKHPADAPAVVSREAYQSGPDRYRARDLDDLGRAFLAAREGVEPPEIDAGHSDD